MREKEIIELTKQVCEKFVDKVERGRARSIETYSDCKMLLEIIDRYEKSYKKG